LAGEPSGEAAPKTIIWIGFHHGEENGPGKEEQMNWLLAAFFLKNLDGCVLCSQLDQLRSKARALLNAPCPSGFHMLGLGSSGIPSSLAQAAGPGKQIRYKRTTDRGAQDKFQAVDQEGARLSEVVRQMEGWRDQAAVPAVKRTIAAVSEDSATSVCLGTAAQLSTI
jgi:hypothetical protein